jgi:hypothetical protein
VPGDIYGADGEPGAVLFRRKAGDDGCGERDGNNARDMCGRARLSSDVSEIKLVFSIPPHRPTPNIAPS